MLFASAKSIGVVVVGRNEERRLGACLRSIADQTDTLVYVDSGSTDNSLNIARSAGCHVVSLDPSISFTAARARNEGFQLVRRLRPSVSYVQFVDGDCEIAPGWLGSAVAFLDDRPDVAVVCGRRRESHPGTSVYNELCDLEWDTPIGQAKSCGGDAMMRAEAFAQVGGFRPELIAGEEPELCVRLRSAGWQVWRVNAEMTVHDAAMTQFGQWWRRAKRAGYCFAEGAHLHGSKAERHFVWEFRRAILWGICLPLLCVIASLLIASLGFGPWGWALWLIYPLQVVRLAVRRKGSLRQRWIVATFQVIGRFAEGMGALTFLRDRLLRRRTGLIEYK
jgi:GT2 family glycosyltransferase